MPYVNQQDGTEQMDDLPDGGWVKLWRKSLDSSVWNDALLWKVWTYCLMKANHSESYDVFQHRREPIRLLRGQFVTGRRSLYDECFPKRKKSNPGVNSVWRALLTLKTMGLVGMQVGRLGTVVTVVTYGRYNDSSNKVGQDSGQQVGPEVGQKWARSGPEVGTDKNVKNEENVKKRKAVCVTREETQSDEPPPATTSSESDHDVFAKAMAEHRTYIVMTCGPKERAALDACLCAHGLEALLEVVKDESVKAAKVWTIFDEVESRAKAARNAARYGKGNGNDKAPVRDSTDDW